MTKINTLQDLKNTPSETLLLTRTGGVAQVFHRPTPEVRYPGRSGERASLEDFVKYEAPATMLVQSTVSKPKFTKALAAASRARDHGSDMESALIAALEVLGFNVDV